MKENKIKILHFIRNIHIGGAEKLLVNICQGILKRNNRFEIKVAIFENELDLKSEFERLGVEIICLNVIDKGPILKINKILRLLKSYRPDIIHTHLLFADRFGLVAGFIAGVKNRICTVHSMEEGRDVQDRMTRLITSLFAKKIIVVSNSTREFCSYHKIYPKEKMVTIYNAPGFSVNNISHRVLNKKRNIITLVNIGRFVKAKGHIYLIRAMKILNRYSPNIRLELYGEGDQSAILREEAAKLEVKNLFFRGVTFNSKESLEKADIFISSSIWEGFHMALVEAMSMGLPIIATNIPTHKELFQDIHDYPLLINKNDPQALADSVLALIKSEKLFKNLSIKCIEQSKRYSIKSMQDNYFGFYKSLP